MRRRNIMYRILVVVLGIMVVSCNKSESVEEDVQYFGNSTTSTLVSKFVLGSNDNVLANLDSVFFTIDQNRRLIYNADSLPVGTDVRKLTVSVTFPYSVSSAKFHVTDGMLMQDTTITYSSETKDSIDFTGKVTLIVTSRDGSHESRYDVKVNVHEVEPDELTFSQGDRRDLPNVNSTPHAVKAVMQEDAILCLVHDGDRYVLSSTTTLAKATWSKLELNLPFIPNVKSLAATSDALYMLDTSGELYCSTDQGLTWTDCEQVWENIVGSYEQRVLGVLREDGQYKHDEYPRDLDYEPVAVSSDFPVSGFSPLIQVNGEWSVRDQVVMIGGVLQDGNLTNATWGYDGQRWGRLDLKENTILPAVADAVVIPYYTYDVDSTHHRVSVKQLTWLLMGGRLSSGSLNRVTYVSRNQGMTWLKGDTGLQQPDFMPSFCGAQAFVQTEILPAEQLAPASTTTQPITKWECPYVYIVGGYTSGGSVLNNIWRGYLNRLTFKPLF